VNVNQHEQPRELDHSRKDDHTRRLNSEFANHNGRLRLEECFRVDGHFARPTARTDEVKAERSDRSPEDHRQSSGEHDTAEVQANVNNNARKKLQKSGVNQILRSARRLVRRVSNQKTRRAVAADSAFGQIVGAVERQRHQRRCRSEANGVVEECLRVSERNTVVIFDRVLKDARAENDSGDRHIDAFRDQRDFGRRVLSGQIGIVPRALEGRVVVVGLVGVTSALGVASRVVGFEALGDVLRAVQRGPVVSERIGVVRQQCTVVRLHTTILELLVDG